MSTNQELVLESAETVILGAFHPQIITPEWILSEGILGADGEAEWDPSPKSSGVAFSLTGQGSLCTEESHEGVIETSWEIDYDSLLISSETADCGVLAAAVLDRLPYVPTTAVGHNFYYSFPKNAWPTELAPRLGGIGHQSLVTSLARRGSSGSVEVWWGTTIYWEDGCQIEHTVLEGQEKLFLRTMSRDPVNSSTNASEIAKRFCLALQDAAEVWESVLQTGKTNDHE